MECTAAARLQAFGVRTVLRPKLLRKCHHLLHEWLQQLFAERLDLHHLEDDPCRRVTYIVHVVRIVHCQRRAVLPNDLHRVVAPLLREAVREKAQRQHDACEDVVEIWQQQRAGALLLARLHEVPPEVRHCVPRAVLAAPDALHDLQHPLQPRILYAAAAHNAASAHEALPPSSTTYVCMGHTCARVCGGAPAGSPA